MKKILKKLYDDLAFEYRDSNDKIYGLKEARSHLHNLMKEYSSDEGIGVLFYYVDALSNANGVISNQIEKLQYKCKIIQKLMNFIGGRC